MSDKDLELVNGHICQGGNHPGYIRTYPAVLCSLCRRPSEGTNVLMLRKDIKAHNERLTNVKIN